MSRSAGGRITLFTLIIIALVAGGLVWFDYLGLIDVKPALAPVYRLLGLKAKENVPNPVSADVLPEERIGKRMESLQAQSQELDLKSQELARKDAEQSQKDQEITAKAQELDSREKALNDTLKEYENKKANIQQNAQYLAGMPPPKAVEILKAMDDQSVIDVFHAEETRAQAADQISLVSVWLSGLPPDRAAAIQRKMALTP